MVEEYGSSLETKVDTLAAGHAEMRTEMAGLRTDVNGLRTDVDSLRTEMRDGFGDVRGEIADFRRQMLVLHEETLDTIKTLAPDFEPIRREFRAENEALREDINRRLDPLELAVRTQAQRDRG